MASRYVSTPGGTDFLAAIGGTVNDGDSVYINMGNDALVTNLNHAAKIFPVVSLIGEFSGWVGDPSASLECDITSLLVACAARGLYVKAGTGGSTTNTIAKADLRPTRADCNIVFGTGTYTQVNQFGGILVAADTADVNLLRQTAGTSTLREGAANTPTIEIYGGACECQRDFDNADVRGGLFQVTRSSVTPTSIKVDEGARLDYRGGALASLYGFPGSTLDFSRLTKPMTITNFYSWGGCRIICPPGLVTVTTTTPFGNESPTFPA